MSDCADQMPAYLTPLAASGNNTERPATTGALFVFEGPDGVGKSSLVATVHRALSAESVQPVARLAFPGREPGTLGHHVYELHHDPARFGISTMSAASLQLLHVAAHLDAIATLIRPRVERGEIVLLDRYWWSTWVYGVTGGADPRTMRAMIELERTHWDDLRPNVVFLIRRTATLRPEENRTALERRSKEYETLAAAEAASTRVVGVDNERTVDEAALAILDVVRKSIRPVIRA